MLELGAWRDYLSLERRSVTELVAALTAIALTGATFYNLGFFAPVEWSLISLLTVQDLIMAAAISLLPMIAAALLALLVSRAIRKVGTAPKRHVVFAVAVVAATGIGMAIFLEGPVRSMTGFLVAAYFFLAGLAALANVFFRHALVPTLWLAFSLVYIPLATGTAESLTATADATAAITEVHTEQGILKGRVLRVTSVYLLLYDGAAVTTLPLSKVRMVRRLYHVSPEADFLPLLRSRARLLMPSG